MRRRNWKLLTLRKIWLAPAKEKGAHSYYHFETVIRKIVSRRVDIGQELLASVLWVGNNKYPREAQTERVGRCVEIRRLYVIGKIRRVRAKQPVAAARPSPTTYL